MICAAHRHMRVRRASTPSMAPRMRAECRSHAMGFRVRGRRRSRMEVASPIGTNVADQARCVCTRRRCEMRIERTERMRRASRDGFRSARPRTRQDEACKSGIAKRAEARAGDMSPPRVRTVAALAPPVAASAGRRCSRAAADAYAAMRGAVARRLAPSVSARDRARFRDAASIAPAVLSFACARNRQEGYHGCRCRLAAVSRISFGRAAAHTFRSMPIQRALATGVSDSDTGIGGGRTRSPERQARPTGYETDVAQRDDAQANEHADERGDERADRHRRSRCRGVTRCRASRAGSAAGAGSGPDGGPRRYGSSASPRAPS